MYKEKESEDKGEGRGDKGKGGEKSLERRSNGGLRDFLPKWPGGREEGERPTAVRGEPAHWRKRRRWQTEAVQDCKRWRGGGGGRALCNFAMRRK
jgi:hypothetical protein